MDHLAIVKTVFKAVVDALPTELGALLGQELSCSAPDCRLVSKETLFTAEPRPKSTLSHLKVTGDHEGAAFLILPVKTAITLGGTLIMLPADQITENTRTETFEGEIADAYGEVANILAGVLTQVFLDKYTKNLRFVRTDVEELNDSEVDISSDNPFPPGSYFHLSTQLNIGDQDLGHLEVITPAAIFDLEEESQPDTEVEKTGPATTEEPVSTASPQENKPPATPARQPFADAKKVADVVLKATIGQVTEEVGALLGQTFDCTDLKLEIVSKNDFFSQHCLEKSTLTYMEVSGDSSGNIYLLNQIKDAILMGGTLIMLPEEEIEAQVSKGEFAGEVADAYGEVVNIISGGLTQTFQDRYPQALRFVKTTAEIVVPTKVTPADEKPFADGLYYMASCAINLQGKPLERMHLLFPAQILGLEEYEEEGSAAATSATGETTAEPDSPTVDPRTSVSTARQAPQPPIDATPVVLIIADSQQDTEIISKNLASDHYEVKVLGYKDDIRSVFGSHPVLGIFLLMSEVGEKGFSVAIKLQSSGYPLPPVIAAGPEWTRSAVLKAIKYGARDILVTPASDDEIREKASQHIAVPA